MARITRNINTASTALFAYGKDYAWQETAHAAQQASAALTALTPHIEALSHNATWLGQLETISQYLVDLTDAKRPFLANTGEEKLKEIDQAITTLAANIKGEHTEPIQYIKGCLTLCTIPLLILAPPAGLASLCVDVYQGIARQDSTEQAPSKLENLHQSINAIVAALHIDAANNCWPCDVGYSKAEKNYLETDDNDTLTLTFPEDAKHIAIWLKAAEFGPGLLYRGELLDPKAFVYRLDEVADEHIKYDYAKASLGVTLHDLFVGNKLQSPKENLKTGYGICGDRSLFLADMLRLIGFGARIAGGAEKKHSDGHWWTEVYFPKNGWTPLENVKAYTVKRDILINLKHANGWTPNGILTNYPLIYSSEKRYKSRPYFLPRC